MILLLQLIFSISVNAQVDVQKTNFLLENIVPKKYKIELSIKNNESDFTFVPRSKDKLSGLYLKRSGTTLTDQNGDYEDSNIIVQSWANSANNFDFYTAKRQGEGWQMYRYTDGNNNSQNLSFCDSNEKAFITKTDMYCVFASERICKKKLNEWPQNKTITKNEFKSFLSKDLEGGFDEYLNHSATHNTALRDRMSNVYKLDNFSVVNRIEKAAKAKEDPKGDEVRAETLAKIKSLCKKAWKHHSEPLPQKLRRNAPKLQKTQGISN